MVMISRIQSQLSDDEIAILQNYRKPTETLKGATRLSVQFAIAGGLFMYLAFSLSVVWSVAVYGLFLLHLAIRLLATNTVVGITSDIIDKYERRIEELESGGSETAR